VPHRLHPGRRQGALSGRCGAAHNPAVNRAAPDAAGRGIGNQLE
jgi:hypothetical protein